MNVPHVYRYETRGYHTESFGTFIDEKIQGWNGKRLMCIGVDYLPAGTAHNLSFLEAVGNTAAVTGCRTTCDGGAAASQAVLDVVDAPKDPAGNATADGDYIAYQLADGSWEFNIVDSLSTKAITLKTNIAVAVPDGAAVLIFGIAADRKNVMLGTTASTALQKYGYPLFVAKNKGDPVVFQSDNGTAAGFLKNLVFVYIDK